MAKDNFNEDDQDGKMNDGFDDDDFGLPDLEFSELSDDDLDSDLELPSDDEMESIIGGEESLDLRSQSEFNPDSGKSGAGHANLNMTDEDLEKELSALESEDLDISDSELQAALDTPDFYEEESFDDFDTAGTSVFETDEKPASAPSKPTATKANPFDTAGNTPLSSTKAKSVSSDFSKTAYVDYSSKKPQGNFIRIVIIGTIVISSVGFGLWYFSSLPSDEQTVAKKETKPPVQRPKTEATKEVAKPTESETSKPTSTESAKPVAQKPTVSTPPSGTLTEITDKTGKIYLVVNSFLDGDLAKDYASTLVAKGKSPYILSPAGSGKFYRVAIAEFGVLDEANQSKTQYQEEFGSDIWTLRY